MLKFFAKKEPEPIDLNERQRLADALLLRAMYRGCCNELCRQHDLRNKELCVFHKDLTAYLKTYTRTPHD